MNSKKRFDITIQEIKTAYDHSSIIECHKKLDLSIIQKGYPDSIILDIPETFYLEKGWVETINTVTPYTSIEEVKRRVLQRICIGATHFNFKIQNEWGQIVYPDYTVKELFK